MRKCMMIGASLALVAGSASAQVDGQNVGDGLTLRAVQDQATSFGNATGGGQDSAGGGELNALYGDISGGMLNLGITGNIEANFNKFFIFFDTKSGGENVAQSDNVSGGFNSINGLAGLTWDAAFSPDYALVLEVGGGFGSIRYADLQANTGGDVWTFSGPGDLPLVNAAGGFGITAGWDNSNVLGVDGSDASGALTATTGFEFVIDMAVAFGDGSLSSLAVSAFYANGDANFLSSQLLGESNSGTSGNLGPAADIDFNNIAGNQFVVIPAPGSAALLGLGGLLAARRRR